MTTLWHVLGGEKPVLEYPRWKSEADLDKADLELL